MHDPKTLQIIFEDEGKSNTILEVKINAIGNFFKTGRRAAIGALGCTTKWESVREWTNGAAYLASFRGAWLVH